MAGRERKLICMKHLLLLMGLRGMKRPRGQHSPAQEPEEVTSGSVPTMAWTVLLLWLLTYSSGADSQAVVIQEPSFSVSLGGTVILTCGLSTGSVSTSNYPRWYQQTPGKGSPYTHLQHKQPASLGSLNASLDPSQETKPPSPSRGPSPRTRPTITVICMWIVVFPQ
uniref:Immunoglobulin V-set domain-containing protein n=1 Tax=Equus asinus TaxID=9793 RepID=A0A9L0JFD2_EQUAS